MFDPLLFLRKVVTCAGFILLFGTAAFSAEYVGTFCVDIDTNPTTRVFQFAVTQVNDGQYLFAGSHKSPTDAKGSLTGSASLLGSELTMNINATYNDLNNNSHGIATYQLNLEVPSLVGSFWSMSHSNNISNPAWVNSAGRAVLVSCDADVTDFSSDCIGNSCNNVPGDNEPKYLTDLRIIGGKAQIFEGEVLELKAEAVWSDGSKEIVTNEAQWSTTAPEILSDKYAWAPGFFYGDDVTSDSEVIVKVSYSAGGVTEDAEHTVLVMDSESEAEVTLTDLRITGGPEMNEGSELQLTATAFWSNGDSRDVTSSVTWSFASSAISISDNGLVKAGQVSSDKQVSILVTYNSAGESKNIEYNMTVKNIVQSSSRFTINGDGTVTDKDTELTWQQRDDGQTRNWDLSTSYCRNYSPDRSSQWRLPTLNELQGLLDSDKSPMIDDTFTGTSATYYWTSSTLDEDPSGAYAVHFGGGHRAYLKKTAGTVLVRCVR